MTKLSCSINASACLLLLAATGCQQKSQVVELTPSAIESIPKQISGRDLRKDPPAVDAMDLEFLSESKGDSNARLTVKFAPAESVPRLLQTSLEDRVVTLRDDGQEGDEKPADGVHSAFVKADIDEFRRGMQTKADTPGFRGRTQLKDVRPTAIEIKTGARFPILNPGVPVTVDPARSLMINDLAVVEDPARTFNPCTSVGTPMGKWTFGYLMQQMANESASQIPAHAFARKWMSKFAVAQTINNFPVPARPGVQSQILAAWETASGGPGANLDLAKAPFRLLAIVNRVDLRENAAYAGGNAGEMRFVFGALGPGCSVLQFTTIFEYGVKASGCTGIRAWGQRWANLPTPVGSAAYNTALEAMSEEIVKAGADPTKPNGSAINQLRTNDFAVAPAWELREFRIFATDSDAGHLRMVAIKQTPDASLRVPTNIQVRDFVNSNAAAIKLDKHVVPLDFPVGTEFLGAATRYQPNTIWNQTGITDRDARHHFSLNTCDGCHAAETSTFFTHVKPAAFGSVAGLSGFLTGVSVADPADTTPSRPFNDLLRRKTDLETLAGGACFLQIARPTLGMVH